MDDATRSIGDADGRGGQTPADAAGATRPAGTTNHPEQIGPYRILEVIGEGGMGTVYKAEQRTPVRRIVALKLIKLGMDTAQVIARFESERQALAMMDHPSIARVFDAGATINGRPYFVMEYVPGEPITEYCDKHQRTTRQRLELFAQVCDAVQHAHQKGIIHRDIKPSNILVSVRDGKPIPKVIDFGVAKATSQKLTERTLFTETGQLVGTPEYMSPEQAEMSALDVDTRSDVYSLGVVLYELLTGALPFDPKTLRRAAFNEIQRIIRTQEPPRPSTRLSTLSVEQAQSVATSRHTAIAALQAELRRELEWIPLKAMRKDRTERYRTPTELADDVGNYLAGRPLIAGPRSAAYRLRKLLKRNKGPVIAAMTVVLVLLAGIAGTTEMYLRAEHARASETNQRAIAEQQRNEAQRQKSDAEAQRAEAQKQELEAKKQAAIADAVNKFQQDMLASADPGILLGDKVTVLQAILAAVKELDAGELKDQPLVEAAVRDTIGRTLLALGRYEDAQPNLERALQLRQSALAEGHPDIAASLNSLAALLRAQGKLTEAEPLFREALGLRRKALPAGHRDIAQSLGELAYLLQAQGKLAEAEPLYREAVDIDRKAYPAGHPEIATSLNNLAYLLQAQGKLAEAEPLYREAVDIDRKAYPAGHPEIATSVGNLAYLLQAQGKPSEAEPLFREALGIFREAYPAGHPKIALGLSNLAEVLNSEGKLAEAEPLFREALDIDRKALPAGHPDIALRLNNLAYLLQSQGKLAEAEALYREALDMRRKVLPAGHPDIAQGLNNLAALLNAEGKVAEAEPLFREALDIDRKALPAVHTDTALRLNNLAHVLQAEGKLAEAEPLYRESLDIYRKALPAGHPDIATSLSNLAYLLQAEGKLAEAEPLYREALGIRRKALPAGHPDIATSLNNLARVLRAQDKLEEAESMLREALSIRTKSLGPSAAPTTRTAGTLADLLDRSNRHAEADGVRRACGLLAPMTTAPATQSSTSAMTAPGR